ncbi:unnamed protein product [Brassica napus]|nr:unnamed protein product [Brassica napus]
MGKILSMVWIMMMILAVVVIAAVTTSHTLAINLITQPPDDQYISQRNITQSCPIYNSAKFLKISQPINKPAVTCVPFNLPPPFDVGTNLFIGNLDPDVDEKIVYDTFSTFGGIDSNPMPQPVFMFANQAGLDMLETTLVALQDIALEKIFDESGICVLAFRNLFVYNGRHVTYEQAVTWKVFDNDNNNNLHCLAFSFVNWSFVLSHL